MPPLHFSFQEFDEEIDAIYKIARSFISLGSFYVLPQLRERLAQIRTAKQGQPFGWGIPEGQPLITRTSNGDYQPDSKGEHFIYASISCAWEIEPLGYHNLASRQTRKFALRGKASTRVRLFEGDAPESIRELAMWRMEVGDDKSPGCHFHVQVLGESNEPPYPHSLPIPRFPSLLMTPMSVIEFVLAELFQDEWKMHAARSTPEIQRWQPIQRKWIGGLLRWQHDKIMNLSGSPWTSLKGAKPDSDLFLDTSPYAITKPS